jgi:hypothetical protein
MVSLHVYIASIILVVGLLTALSAMLGFRGSRLWSLAIVSSAMALTCLAIFGPPEA